MTTSTTDNHPGNREVARAADALATARLYQDSRARILDVVGPGDWSTAVPACPGWSVRDVVAHLIGVAEDWVSGLRSAPPTDSQTAAQTARFDTYPVDSLVAAWNSASAQLDHLAETEGVAPPLGDLVVHEHDIRGATARPGARDSAAVNHASDQLLKALWTPVSLKVAVEDADYHCGPDDDPEICLRTARFDALRWRTGRRSRAQLLAMNWSADPASVLEHLYLFGPAGADLVE